MNNTKWTIATFAVWIAASLLAGCTNSDEDDAAPAMASVTAVGEPSPSPTPLQFGESDTTSEPARNLGGISKVKWAGVASYLESTGAKVKFQNAADPNLMMVVMDTEATTKMTKAQLQDLANTTQTQLGHGSVVYLLAPGGQTLAMATDAVRGAE